MPLGTVNRVGRGMSLLDGGGDRRRKRGSFEGEFGASHCNQCGLCDAALPKLLWAGLVSASLTINRIERERSWDRPVAYPMSWSVSVSVFVSVCPENVLWQNG